MNEMNEPSSSSRKIIIAIAMAAVVGIGTVTFALRSHRTTAVAQIPAVSASVPQAPDAASSVAQTPAVAAAVPQTPDVPVSAAQRDRLTSTASNTAVPASGDTTPAAIEPKSTAVEPKSAVDRHVAKAHTGVGTTNRTVTRTGSAVDSSEKPAAATVASSMDGGKSVDLPMSPSAPSGVAANAPEVAMSTEPASSSTEPAASDIRITTAVKSEIAADSSSKDANLGVTTTNGVVVLTGTLATQDAIDHVKGVAEKVKDVKSVDTSALKITST
jgi:hyperosmotically inducible periplasmic protein